MQPKPAPENASADGLTVAAIAIVACGLGAMLLLLAFHDHESVHSLFSGIGGFGDWAEFVEGLGPAWLRRAALTIFGAGAYLCAARFSLLELRPLIGSAPKARMARAARLMRISCFTGSALACVAGALNLAGWHLVALPAAASTFGGTSVLLWMHYWLRNARVIFPGVEASPLGIGRSGVWIAASAVLGAVFIARIGPGLRFTK